ncbi:alpha/beta fold hydrolase [Nonomuraea phyllanthi]|uniref:Alpha/beta fold hydrolase n=2 Tax=Nonomuraea phyllanthi TaxID=2219224 RepID=A0A5C4WTK3_9ACTN|nr:alpha/beta fold hydrolase [Nonomuraea phyllanthi]
MLRKMKASVLAALCCTVVGTGIAAAQPASAADWDPFASSNASKWDPFASATRHAPAHPIFGTKKIKVAGRSVNVSCSGRPAKGRPVVILLHGGGDSLEKTAALQKTLSRKNRVCSYDRLGAGASDKPEGPQSFSSTGKILSGVLDRVAGDGPVVLAGHSLGGLIAARYAPDHRDRVKGLVLMDATPPTMSGDISKTIPESAKGPAADVRAQNLAIFQGQNPEQLVINDGKVRSAGDIPVEVIRHGQPYLAAIPTYGPELEKAWAAGQRKWLALSSRSRLTTAAKSGHYIYVDQPEIAVQAIERVTSQAARHAHGA